MQLNALFIRELRTERGWTQQQLADICDLSLRTIQRVELHGIASLETSKALASAFEMERALLQQASATEQEPSAKSTGTSVPVWLLVLTFIGGLCTGIVTLKVLS